MKSSKKYKTRLLTAMAIIVFARLIAIDNQFITALFQIIHDTGLIMLGYYGGMYRWSKSLEPKKINVEKKT